MVRRILVLLAVFCLPLLAPFLAPAQQQQEPPVYTFVALWSVPRDQWDAYTAYSDKNVRPLMERMFADGTVVNWGTFATVVHEEDGYTHGVWWASSTTAGIERVRAEALKNPPNPAVTGAKHRDYLFRSLLFRSRTPAPTSGYLWVSTTQVQAGKSQQWRELWDKYAKPTYDELLANGTISMYEIQVEDVHTENPGWRWVVHISPTAEAEDKVGTAFAALTQKRSTEESRAIGDAFAEVTVAGSHRDYFARVTNYAHK